MTRVSATATGSATTLGGVREQKSNRGDHDWRRSFSAGNYDPNSGEGYVSVPGYGPVGFGGYE
jgi:hypothetical protein